MILLGFLIRLPFEINNKVIDSFFAIAQCNLPVKDLAEKNTLLAYTLLIYNKLLGYKCMWVLGTTCLSPVRCKMFSYGREMENRMFLFVFIVIFHS